MAAKPTGVVKAESMDPFAPSRLVAWESLPTSPRPAPALVWRRTTEAVLSTSCEKEFARRPKPTCSARSYMNTDALDAAREETSSIMSEAVRCWPSDMSS